MDRSLIGRTWPDKQYRITADALRFFAKATGETNPVYLNEAAARAAGHPALPVPPTFLFSAELMAEADGFWIEEIDVPLEKVLHAEQSFELDRVVYAGETLTIGSRISDVYDKKGGLLEFVTRDVTYHDESGRRCALLQSVLVVRHG